MDPDDFWHCSSIIEAVKPCVTSQGQAI